MKREPVLGPVLPELFIVWFAGGWAIDLDRPYEVWEVCSADALGLVIQTGLARYQTGCRMDWACSCRRVHEGALKMRCGSFQSFGDALEQCDALNEPHTERVRILRARSRSLRFDLARPRFGRPEVLADPAALPPETPISEDDVPF